MYHGEILGSYIFMYGVRYYDPRFTQLRFSCIKCTMIWVILIASDFFLEFFWHEVLKFFE